VTSRARQLQLAVMLTAGRGVIMEEFFDLGESRSLPWTRRPQAAALVAALADPDRGWVRSPFLIPVLACLVLTGLDRLLGPVLGGRDLPPPVVLFDSADLAQGIFLAASVAHPPADELADDQACTADEPDHGRSLPRLRISMASVLNLGKSGSSHAYPVMVAGLTRYQPRVPSRGWSRSSAPRALLLSDGRPRPAEAVALWLARSQAASEGLTVVPSCPFARSWLAHRSGIVARAGIEWGVTGRVRHK